MHRDRGRGECPRALAAVAVGPPHRPCHPDGRGPQPGEFRRATGHGARRGDRREYGGDSPRPGGLLFHRPQYPPLFGRPAPPKRPHHPRPPGRFPAKMNPPAPPLPPPPPCPPPPPS